MSQTNILDLNSDCYGHILKYLRLKDHINLLLACPELRHMIEPTSYPVYHQDDPFSSKPVLYYTPEAVKIFRMVNTKYGSVQNKVRTLNIRQYLTRDREFITQSKNKINLGVCLDELPTPEDIYRYGCSERFIISSIHCICYYVEIFRLIPELQELTLKGEVQCSNRFETLSKCYPQLNKFYIFGNYRVSPQDFKTFWAKEYVDDLIARKNEITEGNIYTKEIM